MLSAPRPLPGEFAGASLKPVIIEILIPYPVALPGEFAGASLKRDTVNNRWLGWTDSPRRIRRGLIEAR